MNGRTALVTGASRGIGRAIAERFAELGATVVAPTRHELDLASEESVATYLAALDRPIDILVNNAGVNPLGSAFEVSDADLDLTLQVDLVSPIRLCRAIAPGMAERGWGRIVNIGSIWGTVSKPRRFAYTVAKTGLQGMSRALAVEIAASGVLVNVVAPGFVNTELTSQNNSPAQIAEIAASLPIRRLAEPSEVAEVVAFLASSRNSFVTGQVILADGGYSCL